MATFLSSAIAAAFSSSSSPSSTSRGSRKRSRTATLIDEYTSELLKQDVLHGSVVINEETDQGKFSLSKKTSLDDDCLMSLTKQRDIVTNFRNVDGNVLITFNQRGTTLPPPLPAALPPALAEEIKTPALKFLYAELAKVVAPCDLERFEEITQHLIKCLPHVQSGMYKHATSQDRRVLIVVYVPKLDSSNIRSLRKNKNIVSLRVYPHEQSILAVDITIRQ